MVNKNVLMIVGSYFPLISGGGLQCKNIVDNLGNKVNFKIFTTLDYKGFGKNYKEVENIVRVYINQNNIFSKFFALVKFTYLFLKIYSTVDIIHIHGITSISLLFIFLGKLFKKKGNIKIKFI